MSGTSLDGIDVVVLRSADGAYKVETTGFRGYDPTIKQACLALCAPGEDEIAGANLLGIALADAYADVILDTLREANIDKSRVRAIGCHGQTVRHMPQHGYSVQIVNGARLAERCGLDVICDFRSRDMSAGGQGAPLVPAFHAAVFANPTLHRAVVNIGGIANITSLPPSQSVSGFDCGPGNVLLDFWAHKHLGKSHDENGAWGASGRVLNDLLAKLLSDPYFKLPPPKSTGREYFNAQWLMPHLAGTELPQDVQATLTQFTAETIARAIEEHASGTKEIYVCGGGAHNGRLMRALDARLSPMGVRDTSAVGLDPDWVEAAAFAWLAERWVAHAPGNLPSVTGAQGPRILGCCYPA